MVTSDADYAATAAAHGVGTDAVVDGDPELGLALTLLVDANVVARKLVLGVWDTVADAERHYGRSLTAAEAAAVSGVVVAYRGW